MRRLFFTVISETDYFGDTDVGASLEQKLVVKLVR